MTRDPYYGSRVTLFFPSERVKIEKLLYIFVTIIILGCFINFFYHFFVLTTNFWSAISIFKSDDRTHLKLSVMYFRGQKLSRISLTAKLLYFVGINFRGRRKNVLFVYFQSISITVLRKSMKSQIIE